MGTELEQKKLGFHWLWFFPLCLLVLLLVELHTVTYAFRLLILGYQRWSWGAIFSPSAYICLSIIIISVYWPILGLKGITSIIKFKYGSNVSRRWLYSVMLVVGIFLLPFITDTLLWGTFPFCIDDHGFSRLRLIPFIPWPDCKFGAY